MTNNQYRSFLSCCIAGLIIVSALLLCVSSVQADVLVLKQNQAAGNNWSTASDFNNVASCTGGYRVVNSGLLLRTPQANSNQSILAIYLGYTYDVATGTYTVVGEEERSKMGLKNQGANTITVENLYLGNGQVLAWGEDKPTLAGKIYVEGNRSEINSQDALTFYVSSEIIKTTPDASLDFVPYNKSGTLGEIWIRNSANVNCPLNLIQGKFVFDGTNTFGSDFGLNLQDGTSVILGANYVGIEGTTITVNGTVRYAHWYDTSANKVNYSNVLIPEGSTLNVKNNYDVGAKGSMVFAGDLQGSGALVVDTVGTSNTNSFTLGHSENSFTGTVDVQAGKLQFTVLGYDNVTYTGTNALINAKSVALASGATIDVGATTQTFNNLSGAGNITTSAGGSLTLNNSDNTVFSGVISGPTALAKTGKGTLTLSGVNTYDGNTTVSDGTLVLPRNAKLNSLNVNIDGDGTLVLGNANNISNNFNISERGNLVVGETSASQIISVGALSLNGGKISFDLNDSANDDADWLIVSSAALKSGIIDLTFNNDSETSWWNVIKSYDEGYSLINGNISQFENMQVYVNGSPTTSWTVYARQSDVMLVAKEGGDAQWYYANTNDINANSWTIDGTNKLGVEFKEGGEKSRTFSNPVTMSGAGTFDIGSGYNLTLSDAISGSGSLEKTGAGVLTVSHSNTEFSGATTVSEGTLALTNVNGIGTGAARVESGATLEMATDAFGSWDWAGGVISGSGTLKVTGGGIFNIPVTKLAIDTNGALVADGSTLTINNLNGGTFTGKYININNGGAVTIDPSANDKALWLSNQTEITFDSVGGGSFNTGNRVDNVLNLVNNSATTFTTNGGATNYVTGSNGFNLHNAGITFNVAPGTSNDGVDLIVSAKLWNAKGHGITKNGDGTMKITGVADNVNNYTGATTINAGQVILSSYGMLGSGAGAVSIAQGATLTFADDLAWDTMTNAISGAGKIVKQGDNTVNLDGAFSFSGDVTVNDGALSVLTGANTKQINVARISGAGDLEVRISNSAGNIQFPNLTPDNFTGKISLVNNDCTDSSKVYTNRREFEGVTFEINPGTTVYVEYAELKAKVLLAGDGNKENYGALRLNDNMSGDIVVVDDALLGINGSGRTVSSSIKSGAASGEKTLKIQSNSNNTSNTFSGALSDGETSKLGVSIIHRNDNNNGTISFTGDLSYTGATSVAAGQTLALSGVANLATSSDVVVNGTLNFANYTGENAMQLNNLSGTAGTVAGIGKDLVLSNNKLSTFNGSITANSIEKKGSGTLQLNNETGVAVDVQDFAVTGGRLDLKGDMNGDLLVQAGGRFSPGNSVGTANVTGNVMVMDDGKIIFEFSSFDEDVFDVLNIVNDPTAGSDFAFTGNPSTIELFFEAGDASVWFAALEDDPTGYKLVSDDGFTAGDYTSWLSNYTNFFGLEGRVDGLYLVAAAEPGPSPEPGSGVPEPSTWALLVLGVVGLLLRKRVRS